IAITATATAGDALAPDTKPATVKPGTPTRFGGRVDGLVTPSPTAGGAIRIRVEPQDSFGNVAPVVGTAIGFALTRETGPGTLGRQTTGTIADGASGADVDVTYTRAEAGVVLRATQTSGTWPLASSLLTPFNVLPGAPAKAQIFLPGETPDPNAPNGKTG